ncbi:MAG: SurA N-terminal domain-containing protein [Holosporales bacterium]|jgi:peptidyl-prolyl cis-trans isomerase D|nr:SurA N-terminal domain-containing protein [Holosporales bacterium]
MLNSLRNASNSIIIKILFGTIIFSFCLWGIGDIIRNYSASKSVFSVENAKVSVETFTRQYNQEKQRIRNIGSKPLSDEEMRKLNISKIVLDKMIQDTVLEQAFNKLNIIVSKQSVLFVIQSMPEFQNNGVFDETLYATAIKRAGISEAGFLAQIRESLARTQFLHPIAVGYKLPNIIKNIIEKDFEANRTVLIAKIKPFDISLEKTPSSEELKEYFANNTGKYKKQETRDCAILVVDYKNLCSEIIVSQEEINNYYEENKAAYAPKEYRDFERFVFENREDADKAWNMLNKGMASRNIAKKFTPKIEIIRKIEKSDFPLEIGQELFNLKLSKTSAVYPIGDKFYIYRVANIDKSKAKSELEIKKEIALSLQNEKMNTPEFYSKIKSMKNKIDDGFGSGKSIETIAKETGMKIVELKDFKKSHDNKELVNVIKDEDTRTEIIDSIFSTEENQASQTIDSRETDTMSYVVYTRKIYPEKVPDYEQIAETVKKDFILDEKNQKAIEQIDLINKKGANAAAEVSKLTGVKSFRLSKKSFLLHEKNHSKEAERILKEIPNPGTVLNILSSIKNGHSIYFKIENGDYIVIAVKNIEQASNRDPEFSKMVSNYIDSNMANDIIPIVLNTLKKQMKIKVDNKLIEEITKTSDDAENNT